MNDETAQEATGQSVANWDRWSTAQITAAALAAILLLRILALLLNRTDLFFDESQYWAWSREPAFGYYSKPPLIAWLIAATTALCGQGEACVRLGAPLVHTATAALLFVIGRRLYSATTGFWAAITFATLPGISVSSGLISTDVPLLFGWALALYALIVLLDTPSERSFASWRPALLLGAALGLGLNAKYAMFYFLACTVLFLALTPERRRLLKDARLWAAFAIGALLIGPNLAWNAAHSFATFEHTADNANWRSGSLGQPQKALEFVISQFGVFGPFLFAGLIGVTWRAWRQRLAEADRMGLAFALPILLVVTVQAFLSRAHANWAAPAFVSATLLVTGTLVRDAAWRWLKGSLVLHLVIAALLAAGLALAGSWPLPGGDPFERLLGWRAIADAARGVLTEASGAQRPFGTVLSNDRAVTASLLYYLRDDMTPVRAWRSTPRPRDHFELTRPFLEPGAGPVLLVSLQKDNPDIAARFSEVTLLKTVETKAGKKLKRSVYLFALTGFKSR